MVGHLGQPKNWNEEKRLLSKRRKERERHPPRIMGQVFKKSNVRMASQVSTPSSRKGRMEGGVHPPYFTPLKPSEHQSGQWEKN